MGLVAIARRLPQELQFPMLEFAEAIEEDLRAKLAVRREDFEALQATIRELTDAQGRSEQRLDRVETALVELAEAQKRTEQRVEELAEAQKRTEQRVDRLEIAVTELVEAQKRTEQRVDRLEIAVTELAEAQRRTEQRVDRLEIAVTELAEAQKRTEQRVAELAEAQRRTEQRVDRLETVVAELTEAQRRTEETLNKLILRVDRIEVKLSGLVGDNLERKYREKAFSYLGQILRPVHHVPLQDVLPQLEAHLTEAEIDELLPLDLLLRGRARRLENKPEVWLAVEVSATVDQGDVERAVNRARLLSKAGFAAVPAVAGEEFTEGAGQLALQQKVLMLQDGERLNWPEALEAVLPA